MPSDPIRICFSSGSIYPLDTSTSFTLAAKAGFDGMEVMCDDRWSTRDPKYLAQLSKQNGIPITIVHTPFSNRNPGWESGGDPLGLMHESLALAEALGAEVLVLHLPGRFGYAINIRPGKTTILPTLRNPFKGLYEFMKAGELEALQAKTGVKICVENMPMKKYSTITINPCYWNNLAEWPESHRWLTLDTTHWGTFGIDPIMAYQAAKGRVGHVHLSNFDGREHRLPFAGDLDLTEFLRTLTEDDYTGPVTVELHPDALEFTDEDALKSNMKRSLEFCRENTQMLSTYSSQPQPEA